MNTPSETLSFAIRSYTLKELCVLYRCSDKTFKKWVGRFHEKLGPRVGNLYNPKQVRVIVDQLGAP